MASKNGNGTGTPRGRRKTIVNVLFDLAEQAIEKDEWTISKSLLGAIGKGKTLAETDYDTKTITMYPKIVGDGDPPLETNLLHEYLHVLLPHADEKLVEWLERYMWKHLSADRKERLTKKIE